MSNNEPFIQRDKNSTDLYPRDIYEKLEFNKILDLLCTKCLSPMGIGRVQAMRLQTDAVLITKQLQQTHEFKQLILYEEQAFPTDNYLDLKNELTLLGLGNSVLSEEQFFKVAKVLRTIGAVAQYFAEAQKQRRENYPEICQITDKISLSKALVGHIKAVLDDNGKVRTEASKELSTIRRAIQNTYRDLEKKFNGLLAEYRRAGFLSDTEETMRNGRRVLAIPSEHKRKIRGIVHDISGTGQTVFIEPEETLHINNELIELHQAERNEVYRILRELTDKMRPFKPELEGYQKLLGLIDFIRAKALLAQDMNAAMPRLSSDKSMELFNARHPLLYLKNKAGGKKIVPLNLHLNIAERILLVSGPNAGGKSVLLKTVGLLQIMMQSGLLVPAADHSLMCIFRNIFVDIGDEQSIENDLSTYSSRLKNYRYFTDFANAKTLLLIDEFGSGTDPVMGGAIAETVLEALNKKFCYGIITTHYANLKVMATRTKGIFNGCMLFDGNNLQPLYKLDVGKPGSSFAFELAVKSGLNPQLISVAKEKMDINYKEFDELLASLQREKHEIQERERIVAAKESDLTALISQYKEKYGELEKKRKQILLETEQKALNDLQETNRKFDTMLREWGENKGDKALVKQIKSEIERDKQEKSQVIETLKDGIYYRDSKAVAQQGAFVRLRDGHEIGIVLELRKDQALVEFEQLRSHIKLRDLVVVEAVKPKEHRSKSVYTNLEERSKFETGIDIRGMRRDEALTAVENLIDRALIFNVHEVKIIHGIGDGILRRSVRELLRKYTAVSSVNDEELQYGGAGVSIVALK